VNNISVVSLDEALSVYRSMPPEYQIPSLMPDYANVDSFRDTRHKQVFWIYSKSSFKCLRSFHVITTVISGWGEIKDIEYPYGYGGVICTSRNGILRAQAHQEFCAWAHEENILVEFCRIHPLLTRQQDFFPYKQRNRDVVCIDLADDIISGYQRRRRSYIRTEIKKDIRLICAKSDAEMALFKSLYAETMRRADAQKFYFFNDQYYEGLFRLDTTKLWLIYYAGLPLAGAIVLESENSRVAEYHLGAYVISNNHRPMETLLHLIAEHYKSRQFRYFYLGGGRSTSDNDTLLNFKRGFSKNLLQFDVGFNVFNAAKYDKLRLASETPCHSTRVIFYREH